MKKIHFQTLLLHLQNSLNITKTIHKFPINPHLVPLSAKFGAGQATTEIKGDYKNDEEAEEESITITGLMFDEIFHQ